VADHICEESAVRFADVCSALGVLGVPFVHDARLVRGLDYYTGTTFEFKAAGMGAQSTVLAGVWRLLLWQVCFLVVLCWLWCTEYGVGRYVAVAVVAGVMRVLFLLFSC